MNASAAMMPRRSGEPNHGNARTAPASSFAGWYVGRLLSAANAVASGSVRVRISPSLCPANNRSAGRTNNSNPTYELTGLPGSPNTIVSPFVPNNSGFPGFIFTWWNRIFTPKSASTFGTRSSFPADTPPARISTSDVKPSSIFNRNDASVSRAIPR